MSKSHHGTIVATIVAVSIAAALGTAYATRDKSASETSITAVGSTALQPFVEAAGEEYAKINLGTFVNVQGGGTGTGLSQVAQGAVDLGNSDVFAEEKEGINANRLVDHQVAVVGIAPLLNKDIGLKNLSTEQLQAIFTGKVTNWQQVGGKNQKIVIINRAAGSGTRATFEKWGLLGKQSIEAQEQDSSGMVRSIVATTPGAISYAAFGYIDDTIVAASVNHVSPLNKNVASGMYPIWSYEHVYTNGKPTPEVAKFLNYLTSKEIQSTLVPKLGYISIHDMRVTRQLNGNIIKK
ncbi:phosphate ABC transporter substrate-binding protein PstS family protein [Leuconostoc gasicomitatum]|uniref:phosphate ABC transporter substrate-binding protein PstS family protein n=1 Tax=Leuconostoc gasicomitatum TaxID=115778 RepID=UPI0012660F23|nr:phosphate ABC transporter substrate-binding protein PstS family protein [Leuconostoc gasicomitatum]MBZ5943493.1 phosphate ABC transporter substrate-binding protein PstS family protein [Leuconostoc gasicomitatum]MBZ5966476.1 phosphate ABC transporter substrate-binding protein PstS family protein [Leuconostoc gasicomitatum]MBZ5971782.1 phosphate ABC transporter substrate-binding protein PstS family protein [Leuconostoc gasicomitatum]QFS15168.1 phosphate ABC transporter substrate-binding protei